MGVILFFVFRSLAKHLRKIQMAARAEAEAAAAKSGTTSGEPGPGTDAVTGPAAGTAGAEGRARPGPGSAGGKQPPRANFRASMTPLGILLMSPHMVSAAAVLRRVQREAGSAPLRWRP